MTFYGGIRQNGYPTTRKGYSMLNDEGYNKAIGQLRLQLNGVFKPFSFYGMDVYKLGAIDAVVDLALKFHRRLNGEDVPIILERDLPDD